MPKRGTTAQKFAVPLKTNIKIIQQRLDRADVQDAQPCPSFRQYPRQCRKEGCLGFSASCWCEHDQMLTVQDFWDDGILEWSQLAPAEAVHDVVLDQFVLSDGRPRARASKTSL